MDETQAPRVDELGDPIYSKRTARIILGAVFYVLGVGIAALLLAASGREAMAEELAGMLLIGAPVGLPALWLAWKLLSWPARIAAREGGDLLVVLAVLGFGLIAAFAAHPLLGMGAWVLALILARR